MCVLCVCLPCKLLSFVFCNLLFFLLLIFFFLFASNIFFFGIGPLHFQAGCRKMQLNLGYNLSRFFMLYFFVFGDLYIVDLVVVHLVLC